MSIGDAHYLSFEYFIMSWFVLLTELELFYNYYYKFLVGSSLGTVERLFVPCQAATNDVFILFLVLSDLCHSSNQDFGECSSVWYCVSLVEFAILPD